MSPLIRIPEALFEPQSLIGAVLYAALLLVLASVLARALRGTVDRVLARDQHGHIDRTVASFLTQLGQIAIFIVAFTVYAHIIPELQRVGTALLAGVSIASVVIGLAAQNTLGNLIAGLSLALYRPIRLDDLVQVTTPAGPETGIVEQLTLGYTLLRTADDRRIVVPNSTMATQVTVNLNTWNLRAMAIVPVGIGADEDIRRRPPRVARHRRRPSPGRAGDRLPDPAPWRVRRGAEPQGLVQGQRDCRSGAPRAGRPRPRPARRPGHAGRNLHPAAGACASGRFRERVRSGRSLVEQSPQ